MRRSAEFPATVRLDVRVDHDSQIDNIFLIYELEILPMFFGFEGKYELVLTMGDLDKWQVVEWLDQRILEFVDTYLQIPSTPQYFGKSIAPQGASAREASRSSPLRLPSLRLSCVEQTAASVA